MIKTVIVIAGHSDLADHYYPFFGDHFHIYIVNGMKMCIMINRIIITVYKGHANCNRDDSKNHHLCRNVHVIIILYVQELVTLFI